MGRTTIGAVLLTLVIAACGWITRTLPIISQPSDSGPSDDGGIADSGPAADAASDSGQSDYGGSVDCVDAGGQCFLGDVICTGVVGSIERQMTCPGWDTPGGQLCCLPRQVDCGQPDAATVTCPDAATIYPPDFRTEVKGGSSCEGFPTAAVTEPFAEPLGFEQDAAFPMGCTVTFPFCDDGALYQCTCSGNYWSCGAR